MRGLEHYIQQCGLEESLLHLIRLRAIGENEQRTYSLDAWRECPYYSDRERAALAWTEAVTLVAQGHVPDAVYEEAWSHFSEKELSDLTVAVAAINAWNRLCIAARIVPGSYQPAKAQELSTRASSTM
jgi:alkylhydroperoxidase family enzyme